MGARVFPKIGAQPGEDTRAKLGFKEGERSRSKGIRRAEKLIYMGRIGVGWGLYLAQWQLVFPQAWEVA